MMSRHRIKIAIQRLSNRKKSAKTFRRLKYWKGLDTRIAMRNAGRNAKWFAQMYSIIINWKIPPFSSLFNTNAP